jgi:hypothetical protein
MRIWLKDHARKLKIEAETWDSFIDKVFRVYGMKNSRDAEGYPWFMSKVPFRGQWFIKGEGGSEHAYFKGELGEALTTIKTQVPPITNPIIREEVQKT